MPVKRSRAGSPSSHLFKHVATSVDAGVNPRAVIKADVSGVSSQSKILNLAYPLSVVDSDRVKIGGFLERCHYCKKRIAQNSEVFMYRVLTLGCTISCSDLCAFCSAECRDLQIALDLSAKEQPTNPKEKVVDG
ncbi:hypothetical protein Salat_0500100 [Sesamum alatum]|uniref:FLZ-type domain-containing protein n=1 Tax=Sesamum alatum TaxID=300844 RepID=A0AAE1Z4F1_9LAMI|nr:hypothetical protein Salat_0500100 [Sesamum alatum]